MHRQRACSSLLLERRSARSLGNLDVKILSENVSSGRAAASRMSQPTVEKLRLAQSNCAAARIFGSSGIKK